MILMRFMGGFMAAFFILVEPALAKVSDEAQILSADIINELDIIGAELLQKSGVELDLVTSVAIDRIEAVKNSVLNAPNDKIALVLIPKSSGEDAGLVDIYASKSAQKLFDKDEVLSPFSHSGSILPLLVSKKTPQYAAAMLNGYADISERVARAKNIELKSAIGDSNRTTLNIFRYLIYGTVLLVIAVLAYRKIRKNRV